jgi:hypothetical protein
VIAGVLYAVDPMLPFIAVASFFGTGALLVTTVRYAPHVRTLAREAGASVSLHEALEGFRFIRRQPVLFGAITLDLMAVLFGGAVALLPAIAEDRLGVGAVGLGWLRAAIGIGAAIMTIGLAIRPVRRHIGVVLLIAVAAFGVGTVALGLTRSFAVAFVALAVSAAADSISVYIRATLVPLVTPDEMRGRVLAVEMVLIGASNELGAFESGVAGQAIGAAAAIVLGGFASVGVAIGWWFLFPALRRVDRFPTRESEVPPPSEIVDTAPIAPEVEQSVERATGPP